MKLIPANVTDETAAVLESLGGNLSAVVEKTLWQSPQFKRAAKAIGVEQPERPKRGRPKKSVKEPSA